MYDIPVMKIQHGYGYYSLYMDGSFEGNYDTKSEAVNAYDDILKEKGW